MSVHPPEIPKGMLEEVGRLCGAWAFLEYVIGVTIDECLGATPEIVALLTRRLDVKGRWDLLLEVSQQHRQDLYEQVKPLTPRMISLARDRNLIVHGLIGWDPNVGIFWEVAKGAFAGKPQPATEDFVRTTRKGVQVLADDVRKHKLSVKIGSS